MISIDKLIDNQSISNPNKVAIKHGEKAFTYKQVNEISNQLARFFKHQNIYAGDVIAIAVDRSPEMIILLLAIIKTGATYLPIDNNFPVERINYMLSDSSVKALIISKKSQKQYSYPQNIIFIEDALHECSNYGSENLSSGINEDSISYILYTSGSTGKPKGVKVKHLGLTNFLLSMQKAPGISDNDILLATTTISFDIAQLEIFLPLISGATVVVASSETVRDGRALLDIAKSEQITIMQGTPFMWRTMLEAEWVETLPIKILCGGEAMPRDLAKALLPRCASLWNMYGPTETTIWSLIKKISANDEIITIGRPIDNTQVYILDDILNEVPKDTIGEICIGGDGVSDGYLNRPELTAEKFINDKFSPASGQKIYRTGDLGKLLDNEEFQCLGRIDHQIKIRGYRIETEEIEYQLKQQKNIKEALIILYKDALSNAHLVAYIVPVDPIKKDEESDLVKSWKSALRVSLPEYMIPNAYMIIDTVPLMSNGKIDHKALPEPIINQQNASEYEEPQTDAEIALLRICSKYIAINKIGVTDNLFDLGIDSLVAVSIMVQVEKEFGKRLPLSVLVRNPTIRQLAAVIQNYTVDSQYKCLVPIKPEGTKLPLYIIHGIGLNLLNLQEMILNIDGDQPIYGLQSIGLDGTVDVPDNLEEIARFYNDEIIKHDPAGPYAIAGYSFGGFIAFEMVKQLKAMGKEVKLLAMFDTNLQYPTHQYPLQKKIIVKGIRQFKKIAFRIYTIFTQPVEAFKFIETFYGIRFRLFFQKLGFFKDYHPDNLPDFMQEIAEKQNTAFYNYEVKPANVRITIFKAKIRMYFVDDPKSLGWGDYALEGVETHEVPGDHKDMFGAAHAKTLAKILQSRLDLIQ
jgi:amino acid adenylation domain-containing protein